MTHLEQGSKEWLDYRRTRIGASDIPIIMGTSPYKTARELMEEKLGLVDPSAGNGATRYGQRYEQEIIEYIQNETGIFFQPAVITHPDFDWLVASLDGLNFQGNIAVEAKTCNPLIFAEARKGIAVPNYYDQMMAQFICKPELEKILYVCRHKPKDCSPQFHWFEVYPDPERIAYILDAVHWFRDLYVNNELPPPTEKAPPSGYRRKETDNTLALAERYEQDTLAVKELKERLKIAELNQEASKSELLKHVTEDLCVIGNVRITKYESRGTIDYKAASENSALTPEELEQFRRPGKTGWKVTIGKQDD